ncbi:2898_t:CDS:10, partial [Entrophospora sp. SA101]
MTQIIHEGTNPDFFVSMKKYINWSGKISIPDILGFGNPDIIHDLQAKVNSIYPNIFETSVALTKPQNKMVKLTATMQKKGEKIIAKARNSLLISQDPIICQGIEIKETGLNLSSEATLALAIDYESSKKSSDALRKRFKHAKADLEYAKNLKYNQYEKKNKDSLKDWVQKTIEENKFGSTILVNTEQYLTNIFIQPCLTCHNLDLSKKKLKVNKIGYNLQITINCKMCQGITEYNNELPGTKFSLLAAGAGLVGGVNRRQLQTIFSMMGVTTQSSKVYADLKHVGKNIRAKIAKNSIWKDYENTIMTYYNSCVYAASGRKLDGNKITVSDDELEKQNQKNIISIAERNQERGKKIQEQKRNLETFDWDKDYVPYGHSVQEKIKAKEFEPTFAKYIFDFEKIIKCLACDAFPKYSPTGLCQYHDFCLKFGYHHEFPNNQYTPPSQDLKANPPTSYDVLTKVFKYQKFQESQEMAISEYVNGNHTFVSMRTGAGKSMCYWISAIMRGGLTIVISPLVSLIDDQVIETIAAGIGCASIYTEIAVGLTKLIYVTAESFVYNESFTKMLLNFSKNSPVSFVIDEENHHLFPDIPIMMLTGTCKEIDAHAILENLCISPSDVTFVQGISFSCPELKIEVHSKSTKEKLIREIIMLLKELEDGKCIIYCPTVHVCDNVYELLCEKADLDMIWQCITIMIATNAFGMGINDKKIRLVIHYTFPLSIGNLVQETGRAERDHNSAKSVIFYSRHDICTNYTIITQGRELVTEEVDEVNLMSDVLKMVEVSEEVVNKLNKNGKIATPKNIIQVYCQLKCDHEELTLLNTYKDKTFKQERLIKTKAEALHLLDLLIIRKIVKVMINLYRPNSNGSILQTNLHIF